MRDLHGGSVQGERRHEAGRVLGELALAQTDCTLKWFGIKGTRICEILPNLPITLLLQLLIRTPPCQGFAHGCRGSTRGHSHLAPQWLDATPLDAGTALRLSSFTTSEFGISDTATEIGFFVYQVQPHCTLHCLRPQQIRCALFSALCISNTIYFPSLSRFRNWSI